MQFLAILPTFSPPTSWPHLGNPATAINQVDLKFMFSYENVHPHVNIFNKTMNIFSKFIPNKLVTFDDKDPPWMTEKLKEKIKSKHKIYGDY